MFFGKLNEIFAEHVRALAYAKIAENTKTALTFE